MKVKTMTSNALLTNSKTVPEYVESINEHLTNATESWLRVAREFADAKTALSKSDFKELLKQTRFTSSTISKLIKIATSERVKKYEPKLALIDAWSTMHEITKLDDEQFKQFAAKYLSSDEPQYFKRSDVERMKRDPSAKPERKFDLAASIRVNLDAIDNSETLQPILSEIQQFVDSMSQNKLVSIDMIDIEDKVFKRVTEANEKLLNRELREAISEARKKLRKVVKDRKQKFPRKNRKKAFVARYALSEEEIFDKHVNPNDILEELSSERVRPEIVDPHFKKFSRT